MYEQGSQMQSATSMYIFILIFKLMMVKEPLKVDDCYAVLYEPKQRREVQFMSLRTKNNSHTFKDIQIVVIGKTSC